MKVETLQLSSSLREYHTFGCQHDGKQSLNAQWLRRQITDFYLTLCTFMQPLNTEACSQIHNIIVHDCEVITAELQNRIISSLWRLVSLLEVDNQKSEINIFNISSMFTAQVDEQCSNQHWKLTLYMQFTCWNFLRHFSGSYICSQLSHTDMLYIQNSSTRFHFSHAYMHCEMRVAYS